MPALAPDEVQRLIRGSSGRGHTGSRNRALVAIFAGAGLGVTEALAVMETDLQEAEGRVRVGGSRRRTVAVDAQVMESLMAWVAERGALRLEAGAPLFCTKDGLPLEASYVRRLIARLGREAGIDRVVNARALRESYAAARMSAGVSAEELRAELGHSSIASTQRFVRQLGLAPARGATTFSPELVEALLGVAHCGVAVLRAERDRGGPVVDFAFEYVNPAASRTLGFAPEELTGRSVREAFPNAPSDGTYARWIELIETRGEAGEQRHFETEARTRELRVRRAAFGDRILMSFEDHDLGRAAEQSLSELEARHAALLDACQAGVMVTKPSGTIAAVNGAAERILGIPVGRLIGRSAFDPRWRPRRLDGDPLPASRTPIVAAQSTGHRSRGQILGVSHPHGHTVWIAINAEPIEAADGPPYGVVATFVNVGETRRVEARARGAEAAVSLVEQIAGGFLQRCRPDGTIISVSASVTETLGVAPDAMSGRHWESTVEPADRPVVEAAWLHALESRDIVSLSHRARDRSGSAVAVSHSLHAVRDPDSGEVEEVQSLIRLAG